MLLWHDCITARYTPIHTFTPLAFIWLDLPMRVKHYPKERYWLLWDILILQYYRLFCSKWDNHTGLAKSYWPSQQLQPCMLPWKRQGWRWHPESLPQHMSMGQGYIIQAYITHIIHGSDIHHMHHPQSVTTHDHGSDIHHTHHPQSVTRHNHGSYIHHMHHPQSVTRHNHGSYITCIILSQSQHMTMGQTYITCIIFSQSQHTWPWVRHTSHASFSVCHNTWPWVRHTSHASSSVSHNTWPWVRQMSHTSSSVCHNTWPWVRQTSHTSSSVCHKTESLMSIKSEQCNEICSNKSNSFHGMQKGGPSPFSTRKSCMDGQCVVGTEQFLLLEWCKGRSG